MANWISVDTPMLSGTLPSRRICRQVPMAAAADVGTAVAAARETFATTAGPTATSVRR